MNIRLHVENLEPTTSESQLAELFSTYGNVVGVHIPLNPADSRPCGVGIVTMMTPEGARAAVQGLDGAAQGGGLLKVREARPNEGLHAASGRLAPRRMVSHLF